MLDFIKDKYWHTLNFLQQRRRAYQLTFSKHNPAAQAVLADLVKFCHWGATPFNPSNKEATYIMMGRQQVLLRIKQHLGLSDEKLFAIYSGEPFPDIEGNDND